MYFVLPYYYNNKYTHTWTFVIVVIYVDPQFFPLSPFQVLIVGSFLGSKKHNTETKWGCMFGEIEVSAEVLSNNVIRCQTPLHAPGCVPFYVTCRNRLACSEVREFEYQEKPIGNTSKDDELRFQIRLAKLLSLDSERKWLECTALDCDKCKLKSSIFSMRNNRESDWERIDGASVACKSDHLTHRDVLIQNLLKDRLCEWLVCKLHEGGKGPHVLDNEGQGVLHLTAALGYEWAMGPIIASGISPNFRDARGRTGLHWASYFGRYSCCSYRFFSFLCSVLSSVVFLYLGISLTSNFPFLERKLSSRYLDWVPHQVQSRTQRQHFLVDKLLLI